MLPCGLAGEMPEPIVPPACRITSPSGVDLWVGGPRLVGALVGALWLGSPVPEGTDPVGLSENSCQAVDVLSGR